MDIFVSVLKEKIQGFDKIAIYGCGVVAEMTYHALMECGKKAEFCVVTKKVNMQDLFQSIIPVYEIGEKAEYINNNNVLVLIGVSELYEKEISEILQKFQIKNYLCITDFERMRVYERYMNMSESECLDEIAEWYAQQEGHIDKKSALDIVMKNINAKRDENKIVFAIGALTPRLLKIADALREQGYEIKLIASPQSAMQDFCINALEKKRFTCVYCVSIMEFVCRILMERSKIIHLFTTLSNSWIDRILINMKELLSPIVYDEYDIYSLCYTGMDKSLLENERYCLEHADAVCNRGYEIEYLVRNGYQVDKSIQFSDYCGNEHVCVAPTETSELSVCYCGNLLSKEESLEWVQNFWDLAELCTAHNCHFHVYPHIWNEKRLQAYIEMDQLYDSFHLHQPIPYEQLKYELSKHDYGVYPINKKNLEQGMIFNLALSARYGSEVITYAHTNKYFDYLDAGLPIIAANPIQLIKFLKTKSVVLEWTIEDYDFDEMRVRRKELKEGVKNAHYELQVRQHVGELLDFYTSVENERIGRQ